MDTLNDQSIECHRQFLDVRKDRLVGELYNRYEIADSMDNRSSPCNFIKEVLCVKIDRFKIYEKDFCDHSDNIPEVTPSRSF